MNVIKKTFFEFLIVVGIGVFLVMGMSQFLKNEDFETINAEVQEENISLENLKVRIKDIYLNLEVADDDISRALGLMNREVLEFDEGMIFVYEDENIRSFWMKNVLFSLDMIYINLDYEIVGFLENVPVCHQEPCDIYSIDEKAKYVIEVNAGWISENKIELGERVDFLLN